MSQLTWLSTADRTSPWQNATVVVAGIGRAGFAAADALLELGAKVRVLDASTAKANQERATVLETLGAEVRLGCASSARWDENIDLVIVSPGWRPTATLLTQASEQGVPVWGDVELAIRLMSPNRVVPWLGVTGTNGKTTTIQMLESMLAASGLKVAAVGNIGRPIIEAINDPIDYDVFAVELSSFQLHYVHSLELHSAAVLNFHQDHLEWYANDKNDIERAMASYAADKAKIYRGVTHSCVYNVKETCTQSMVEQADVHEGARAIGFTLGIPGLSMIGVVDDTIVDRAFIEQRRDSALPLASLDDVHPYAPHNIENALAAAALARSFGVRASAVKEGLQNLQLGSHRIQTVAKINGVTYVDDSKATNPHAADASLRAFDSVVWIAGGQSKGTRFDDLVIAHATRLKGAVLLGVDKDAIAETLARHAPDVPVIMISSRDTGAMAEAVKAAARLARNQDVVLLAPGCASRDMWTGYDARGDDFIAAVHEIGGESKVS